MRGVGVLVSLVVLIAGACGGGETGTAVSGTTGTASATAGEPVTAFVNVTLVSMTADVVGPDQTVVVAGDRIVDIGPAREVDVPASAAVVDGRGAYLMPGLADMHVHLDDVWPVPILDLFLANGVTTVRNLHARDPSVLAWRDSIAAGSLRGPKIFTAGPTIYEDAEDLGAVVATQLDQGYDFIKLYSFLSQEGFGEVMAAVRERGGYAVGHVPFAVGLDGVVAAGMHEVAHIDELALELIDFDRTADLGIDEWFPYIFERLDAELQSPNVNELLEARIVRVVATLGGTGVPVVTTAVVSDVIVEKLLRSDGFLARPESKFLPSAYVTAFQAGAEKHQVQFAGHEDNAAVNRDVVVMLLEALREEGVPLLLGTDAGTGSLGIVPGFTIHRELAILTDNGLTPYEAIRTGTVNASAAIAAMTGNDDFGTVEVGKRADLLLVGANPLEDVAHIETQLRGVMAAGTWYTQAELREMIAYDP